MGNLYHLSENFRRIVTRDPEAMVIANGDAPIFSSRKAANPVTHYGFELHG